MEYKNNFIFCLNNLKYLKASKKKVQFNVKLFNKKVFNLVTCKRNEMRSPS